MSQSRNLIINFKTSYVEVYPFRNPFGFYFYTISKHLMLKFIGKCSGANKSDGDFKTSYVEVYPVPLANCGIGHSYFKTSYVEVYPTFSRYFHLLLFFSLHFFLISIIFTKHQSIFFFLSNISQIPRLYNTFSTFFFFSPGKYFYNSQSSIGCSSDVFTTENEYSCAMDSSAIIRFCISSHI